jgi:hypothetical protein
MVTGDQSPNILPLTFSLMMYDRSKECIHPVEMGVTGKNSWEKWHSQVHHEGPGRQSYVWQVSIRGNLFILKVLEKWEGRR